MRSLREVEVCIVLEIWDHGTCRRRDELEGLAQQLTEVEDTPALGRLAVGRQRRPGCRSPGARTAGQRGCRAGLYRLQ